MWKQDCDDKTQYQRAEWRHVLNFTSCTGVRVEGLTLADSGSDGIYLGVAQQGMPCSDVTIRNVSCVNNHRQGISVISTRNLLIEGCSLTGTSGTAPAAGIDFEPNDVTEELVNCVCCEPPPESNQSRCPEWPSLSEHRRPSAELRPLRDGVSSPNSARFHADLGRDVSVVCP
jgi:hypothetical protein